MKKVLSLILALAMVFTCVPFVFAEGEAVEEGTTAVIPDTFDLAEAYAVDYEFTGDASVDYPNAMPAKGSDYWQVGSYSNRSGYETFSTYNLLNRMYSYCRAYEDDKAGDVQLDPNNKESVGKDTTRYPQMVWNSNAGRVQLSTTDLTNHWQGGGLTTYGDGGYAVNDPNAYTGSLGYGFNNAVTKANSSLGYQNDGSVHPAAVFTVPKAGFIKPVLKISGNTNAVWKLYRQDAEGNLAMIYPTARDMTTSITSPDVSVTVPEKWKDGWAQIPASRTTYDSEGIWVEEGDKIVLRFAAIGVAGKGATFNLNYYTLNYITELENEVAIDYRVDDRLVDLSDYIRFPDGFTISVDEAVLTETDELGVYTLAEDYVDGSETTVTIEYENVTQTINATFKKLIMVYDLGELFTTTDTYTEDYVYPAGGQTPAMANDGLGIWSVGYYTLGEYGSPLHRFTQLARYGVANRAYEDTASAAKGGAATMSWIATNNNVKTDDTTGWYCNDPNGSTGSIGYNFRSFTNGNHSYLGSSALGWCSDVGMIRNQAVVFSVPRDGVINPQMLISARYANAVLYRMDKVTADGTVSAIYPLAAETKVDWVPHLEGAPTVPAEYVSGWGIVPNGYDVTTLPDHTEGYARVEKGDKIVLRFAPYGGGNTSYAIDYLTMNYTEQFGPDDELFTTSPMAPFEESYTYTYPTDKVAEITTTLANLLAKGTIEYKVEDEAGVLRATATAGVYELTGAFNIGGTATVVTAEYYSPGMSSANGDEPRFTQSANVFVQPLSNTEATFEGGYDIFDLSEMSYDMDEAFILPYYSNAAERAIYGVVDLGITNTWKNATVTFSDPSKFEYLGNGRIRALASYNFSEAGGTQGATDGTTVPSKTGGATLTSVRDKASMGEPIVMTVTASDGGVRKFGLWAFATTVQKLDGEDANPNAYTLYPSSNTISNAVVSVEGYTPDGTFIPTYRDPACGDAYSILADHRYSIQHFAPRMDPTGAIYLSINGASNWEDKKSNRDWHNARGISQTFTAPKDGTINLTGYWPADGYWYNAEVAKQMAAGNCINYTVALYDADDTLVAKLWEGKYGVDAATDTFYKLVSSVVNEEYATAAEDEAKTLTFDVQKGQKVRVMLDYTFDQNWNAYLTFSRTLGHAPAPVWTYDDSAILDGVDAENNMIMATPSSYTNLANTGVLAILYNEAGQIVETVRDSGEDGAIMVDAEAGGVAINYTNDFSYAKIFFWDSLENIKPLSGDILIRK